MRYPGRPLLLLHSSDEFRSRVIQAGGPPYSCWSVPDWSTLRISLRDAPPTAVVVVDPYAASQDGAISPQLDDLLRDYPSTSVIAAVRPDRSGGEALRELGRRGVSEVILLGIEDTLLGIRRTLRQARGRFLKELLQAILPAYVTGRARVVLMAAGEAIAAGGHTPDLARALSVSTKTLARWCERSHLPPARRVLAWTRVLLAARLLDAPGRTVSSVARACGYTSDTALRRALMDFVAMGPTQLREEGAFERAARAFVKELTERREKGRERRRRRGRPEAGPQKT